MEETNLQRHPL